MRAAARSAAATGIPRAVGRLLREPTRHVLRAARAAARPRRRRRACAGRPARSPPRAPRRCRPSPSRRRRRRAPAARLRATCAASSRAASTKPSEPSAFEPPSGMKYGVAPASAPRRAAARAPRRGTRCATEPVRERDAEVQRARAADEGCGTSTASTVEALALAVDRGRHDLVAAGRADREDARLPAARAAPSSRSSFRTLLPP